VPYKLGAFVHHGLGAFVPAPARGWHTRRRYIMDACPVAQRVLTGAGQRETA
jgi:hypothetical protein